MKVKIKKKAYEELDCGGTESSLKYAVITAASNQVIATVSTYEMAQAFITGWVDYLNGNSHERVTSFDRFYIADVYVGEENDTEGY